MAEETIPHYPEHCASCNQKLTGKNQKPYLGYYVLELKPEKSGFKVVCQIHHYYEARCECGHFSKARPGEGYISCVEGRSVDLKKERICSRRSHAGNLNCESLSTLPDE